MYYMSVTQYMYFHVIFPRAYATILALLFLEKNEYHLKPLASDAVNISTYQVRTW